MDSDQLESPIPPIRPRALVRWLWQLTKDVVHQYRTDGVGDLAASITFWTLLSIPAAILALVSALSSVETLTSTSAADDLQRTIQETIADIFADSEDLNQAVSELFVGNNSGVLTIATVLAVYSLSRGFSGLIRALDAAYEVDEGRPWWHVRIVAAGLGLGTIVVLAGAATILAVLPELPMATVFRVLTAPAAFALLVVWAATMFHVGPNHRTPWRYDLPGAVITASGWVLATQGFGLYVRVTDQANRVQSSIGAILLALSLLYLLSIVLLVGAEVNDVISRRAGVVQEGRKLGERLDSLKARIDDDERDDDLQVDQVAHDTARAADGDSDIANPQGRGSH